MATEKTMSITPKMDVLANAQELFVDTINNAGKQREELEKVGREMLERTGVLVRATWQTALDSYDFATKMNATMQKLAVEAIQNSVGVAQKVTSRAA